MEQEHIARIKAHLQHPVIDLSGKLDLLSLAALLQRARLLVTIDSAPMHLAAALGTPQVALFGPTNPFHWRPRTTPATILQGGKSRSDDRFRPETAAPSDEGNLDGTGDRCYANAAVGSGSASHMSKIPPARQSQSNPFWTTIRTSMGSVQAALQLCHALQVAASSSDWLSVFSTGVISSCLPLVMAQGHRGRFPRRTPPAPTAIAFSIPTCCNHGPKINSLVLLCLAIPAVMTARSLCDYANAYYMNWVSNKVLTDIRNRALQQDAEPFDGFL